MPDHTCTTWRDQPILTQDGSLTLFHPEFDQTFHSTGGANLETQHLYMKASGFLDALAAAQPQQEAQRAASGNELSSGEESLRNEPHAEEPRRDELRLLDVGLGLGFNACATLDAWFACEKPPGLSLISLEVDEELFAQLRSLRAPWQESWQPSWLKYASKLKQISPTLWQAVLTHPHHHVQACWQVCLGDAALGSWGVHAKDLHYIWQDAFSHEKNPVLWSAQWFKLLKSYSHESATLMTYSTARLVKTALEQGGWQWHKIPAHGKKREWMKCHFILNEFSDSFLS